jgi:glycosyltransferase involved in cell wall biosynthesis
MKTCDVIIPTYNNADVLPLTIKAFISQKIPPGWAVGIIISDDGSGDETALVARNQESIIRKRGLTLTILPGSHGGIARTRNRAIRASRADIVLLLGADILLRPGALSAHLVFHRQHEQATAAALGMIKWDPRLLPSPLMEWMLHGGQQNDFDSLLGTGRADPRSHFYGSHLSLKRDLLAHERFSTAYQQYGWEDIDLGRRLAKRGLQLTVLHHAIALHRHHYSVDDIYARQYQIGQGIHIYQQRFPTARITPPTSRWRSAKVVLYWYSGLRAIIYWIMRVLGGRYSAPHLFAIVSAGEFWRGVFSGEVVRK